MSMDQQDPRGRPRLAPGPRTGPGLIDIEAIIAKRRARAVEEDRARTLEELRQSFAPVERSAGHREIQQDDL